MDPLAGSAWSAPGAAAGFRQSPPNAVLIDFAERELRRLGRLHVLDLGCGAGRNAVPLARLGCDVLGIDLSWPMLRAAAEHAREERVEDRLRVALAPMHVVPVQSRSVDLVIAHGIWNLARSSVEFRGAVDEAPRAQARPCSSSPFHATPSRLTPRLSTASPSCSCSSQASRSAS